MSLVTTLFSEESKRKKLLKNLPDTKTAYGQYLVAPLNHKNSKIIDIEILALDFETTGLNGDKNSIISMGWSVIKNNRLKLSQNCHFLVRQNEVLEQQNVIVHQITDDAMQQGISANKAFDLLLRAMQNRVLLVHFQQIERNFINALCNKLFKSNLPMLIIDTLELEKRKLQRSSHNILPNHLRLINIRKSYGLSEHFEHNALGDAIATGELFLAQLANIDTHNNVILKDVLIS